MLASLESTLNRDLQLLSASSIKTGLKSSLAAMLTEVGGLDSRLNRELNEVEAEVQRDVELAEDGARRGRLLEGDLLGLASSAGLRRIEATREAIREELETHEVRRRLAASAQFEEVYRRQFTESLPSLRVPAKEREGGERGRLEVEVNLLHSAGRARGEVDLDACGVFGRRVAEEQEKMQTLERLAEELERRAEKNYRRIVGMAEEKGKKGRRIVGKRLGMRGVEGGRMSGGWIEVNGKGKTKAGEEEDGSRWTAACEEEEVEG